MLHAGLNLSRHRRDYRLLSADGERVEAAVAPPDADGLRGLVACVKDRQVPVLVKAGDRVDERRPVRA